MEKINTTAIGDSFESISLVVLKKAISEGQLGYLSDNLRFIPKAKYWSSKRKKNITFDLAIEVWPPGAKRYIFIYLIECKNYKRRVSVDKINTFLFDLNEVGLANSKGIFMTNSPLQEAAYNTADTSGLMLIQAESENSYQIILHRTNRNLVTPRIPFITSLFNESDLDSGAKYIEKLIDEQLLNAFLPAPPDRVSYGINRLSKKQIESIANLQLQRINPKILTEAVNFGPSALKKYIKDAFGIQIIELDANEVVLGMCDMENNTIGLNRSIINTPRELFILCHEFGHFVLHQKLSIGQQLYNSFNDSEYNFRKGTYDLKNPKQWIEWQANCFAASLILPSAQFQARLWLVQDSLSRSRGKILLDDNRYHIKEFYEIVNKLAYRYHVSKSTIIYKLKDMDLINNQSRIKSIGQLILEYTHDLMV